VPSFSTVSSEPEIFSPFISDTISSLYSVGSLLLWIWIVTLLLLAVTLVFSVVSL
jgi:hypothetical protein